MTEELNLKELFSNFVRFISRNSKLLIVFIMVGVIGVISYQKLKTPFYETKAICMSGISEYERQEQIEDLSQRTAIDLVNHLQINIDNEDYNELSTILGVDLEIAESIKSIEAEQLYQQDMNEKFYALNKFEVRLGLFDNSKTEDIQNGLMYYFENNNFVKSYYEEYKKSCANLIYDINSEISSLNEFRNGNNSGKFAVGATNILGGKSKSLSNEIIALSHIREDIITNQNLLKPLVFVQNFAKVEQKEDDIMVWSMLGAVLSFIFGLFIALVREVKVN